MAAPLPIGPGSKTFTGARALLYWNGDLIGFASGCSGSEEVMYDPIEVIGRPEVVEHAPIGYRTTFSANIFRTIARNDVANSGAAPGSLKQQNIFPKFNDILKVEGVDVVIIDVVTKKVIFKLERVKAANYNFNVTARGVVAQNVTFVCIRAYDESEVPAVNIQQAA